MQVGGTAPANQSITLTSTDNSAQFVTASATSTGGFLSVSQSNFNTPVTVTVSVNPSLLTTPGTYTGTVNVLQPTGTRAVTIPVTVNVTGNYTVTPTPSTASLSAAAGSASAATTTVQLTSTDNTIPYTASATVASGSNWLTVSPSSGNLGSSITISANAANLTAGSYTGTVTITAQGATVATIPVTLTVTAAANLQVAPATLTFNYQTSDASAPASQSVQITSGSAGTTLNWSATPTSTGSWLQVTPPRGSTPATFTVSVNPTGLSAGTYNGSLLIASGGASNSPQTMNVTLTVTAAALPQISTVVNGASLAPTVAVPGEIITINGTAMGPAAGVSGTVDSQNFLSTTVSDVRVLFDGVAAPILWASATQINAVVPYEIANRVSTRMTVQNQNQTSQALELKVSDVAPGLFTVAMTGSGQGAILNQNGSVNSATNPERRGNVIVLYGTGQGQTTQPGMTGLVLGNSLRYPVATVTVTIGGQPAEVLYAGSLPGAVSGSLQVNARIPQTLTATGPVAVEVRVGGTPSQAGVTVAIQ